VSAFIPILSDLVPQQSLHSTETEESLERVGQELEALPGERVMVRRANHVADRHSLVHCLRSSDDATVCHLEVTAANGMDDGLYLVDQRNLMSLIRDLW